MTAIKSMSLILTLCVVNFNLLSHNCRAEWCEPKAQVEPQVLETFNYAVDVFVSWNKNSSENLVLGKKIGALISSYSFFIHAEELPGFSTSTLEDLLQVINTLKNETQVFQNEPLRERKETYLRFEDSILAILDCRTTENRKKVQHILEQTNTK